MTTLFTTTVTTTKVTPIAELFARLARLCALLLLLCLQTSLAVASDNQTQVDYILKSAEPPLGVVFEVLEGDVDALDWAIPEVIKYAQQLRTKFPDIAIAVVSHGKEEFGLLKSKAGEKQTLHQNVKSLVQNQDIPVHVCGTHASWRGKTPNDFPDYVDVTPAGPTQIANYEDMGYAKIMLEKPKP